MYIADLHIHSHYSRATSKECTPEYLELWARKKGIDILGTGDFTHLAWRNELKEKLIPAESGLYVLKDNCCIEDKTATGKRKPRFVVSGEISSIYKKNGKVRKIHSLLLLPGLEEAELLAKKLEKIGNIHSDGRPILGLDCHDLLEITLEVCPTAIYIPAHIWTPHFSLFGAFSGFDSIEECFGDLTPYIHALETGLSSDPPMNWRISALDSYQLVSNSDAHSPSKLGREANLLDIDLSYFSLAEAIQTGKGLKGTIEFFPEEGKYHYDGHRKCNLCLSPASSREYSDICPVCGKKLTIGVLHRIEELADREENFILSNARPFESLVPLTEVIAASTGYSTISNKVQSQYQDMLTKLGSEFFILREIPLEEIKTTSGILVMEGIKRLRSGLVERVPGYDGKYGTIKLLDREEQNTIEGQLSLFTKEELKEISYHKALTKPIIYHKKLTKKEEKDKKENTEEQNKEQQEAILAIERTIAVIAGPGTGKTKTLISRILFLINQRKIDPSLITAVTFTNKAANEMKERLKNKSGKKRFSDFITIGTFHCICYQLLIEQGISFTLATEYELIDIAEEIIEEFKLSLSVNQLIKEISLLKTGILKETEKISLEILNNYQEKLKNLNIFDFDDLLLETLHLLEKKENCLINTERFNYLFVDEFQDINFLQYQLICAWNRNGKELFVIGDPDQSIYGFRGSDIECFSYLKRDYKEIKFIRLINNYRSTPEIISCALSVISYNEVSENFVRELNPVQKKGSFVRLVTEKSEFSEAVFIAKEINRFIGGIDMLDVQNYNNKEREKQRSFSDCAILYRTHRQAEILETCLQKEGIPYFITGKDDFLKEKSVRLTICFFRYVLNPDDMLSLKICLKLFPYLFDNIIDKEVYYDYFQKLVNQYLPELTKTKPKKLLEKWITQLNLLEDKPLKKLRDMTIFYKSMKDFLNDLTFSQEGDLKRSTKKIYQSDAVTLMTLHGAKGLEFPLVFLYDIRKGLLPLESGKLSNNIEEERRLFYVGITRAREELILTTSQSPSIFLEELLDEFLCKELKQKQKSFEEAEQLSLFDFL